VGRAADRGHEGDTFGELIPQHGLGLTVPAEDVDALTAALSRLLSDEELAQSCRDAIADYAPDATWGKVLTPLIEFCRSPRRAPDLVDQLGEARIAGPKAFQSSYNPTLRSDVKLLASYFRQGGAGEGGPPGHGTRQEAGPTGQPGLSGGGSGGGAPGRPACRDRDGVLSRCPQMSRDHRLRAAACLHGGTRATSAPGSERSCA
jgi:hypothetical protein